MTYKYGNFKVFQATDYGVIADGLAHNNVANLLDCVAQCVAAGGGTVVLPAGTINTSEASLGTVVADSGRSYDNLGGIPLPTNCPITFQGQNTVLKCSPGFTRGFDLRSDGLTSLSWNGGTCGQMMYRDITIRDITIDRNNISASSLVTPGVLDSNGLYTVPTAFSLNSNGGWVNVPWLNAADWKNVRSIFLSPTNTGTMNGSSNIPFIISRVYNGSVQFYWSAGTWTFAAGDKFGPRLYDHVLIGVNIFGGQAWQGSMNINVSNLLVEDCSVINVVDEAKPDSQRTNMAYGVSIYTSKQNSSSASAVMDGLTFRRVSIYGGSGGFLVGGPSGSAADNILFEDCLHDTLGPATLTCTSGNFQVTSANRVTLLRCTGIRSWDIGLEVDNVFTTLEQDCVWKNAQAAVFRKNFEPPAQSPAGPPTTTLSAALSASTTTCTVSSLPAGVARSGWAQIQSTAGKETVWYSATSADGATWNLSRGLLNSTALSHPSGTKTIVFIEVEKQSFRSIRSKIIYDAPVYAMGGWIVGVGSETYLPQPSITIRDGIFEAHVSPSTFFSGEVIRHTAHCDLDVEGLRATHHGLYYGSTSTTLSSAIYLAGSNGTVKNTGDAPPARLIGRNNVISVAGKSDSVNSTGFRTMTFENYGFWAMDFDLDTRLECNNVGTLRAVNIGGSATTLAPQSRLGLKVSSTVGGGNPLGLRIGGVSFVTLQGPLTLDLDFSEMLFTPASNDGTYTPWYIDTTQLDKIKFSRIVHSPSTTIKYAYNKPLSAVVASNYTVLPWTELVMVDTSSGPVTITLPCTTVGGYSLLGEPLSRGWTLRIIDAGRNARVNPITITPASSDKIGDGTAGSSVQLTDNGQQVTLIAYPSLPGWLSSSTNNFDGTATI